MTMRDIIFNLFLLAICVIATLSYLFERTADNLHTLLLWFILATLAAKRD